MTSVTQGDGVSQRGQGSCGCGGYFRPWGHLIPGKPPSITHGESHREESCPALTDGETNGLWNSISCETYCKGVDASTIMHNHANNTASLRLGRTKGPYLP